jgi:hypothetical protein
VSVAVNGTVLFAGSGPTCGTNVQLFRWPLGDEPERVYSFGKGFDTAYTNSPSVVDGTETFVFDRIKCANNRSDIYRIDFPVDGSSSPSPSPEPSSSACPLPICPVPRP